MLSVDNRAVADVARIVSDWNKRDGHRCNYTQAESESTTHAHPESVFENTYFMFFSDFKKT